MKRPVSGSKSDDNVNKSFLYSTKKPAGEKNRLFLKKSARSAIESRLYDYLPQKLYLLH